MGEYHFTYGEPDEHLCQGDVLAKTPAISAILKKVHPHYLKEDYTHLLVLTQSCDLVRRRGARCNARYISLAAVRPLNLVLERALKDFQDDFDVEAGVCAKGAQSTNERKLAEFTERVLNNNDPDFFYLEPELSADLVEASCAFLRLSIAVRAGEHYDTLLQARKLALNDVFQAKLGWLVGNMYSRVGTHDWRDIMSGNKFATKIAELLGGLVQWVDDEQLALAKKTMLPEGVERTRATLLAHVKGSIVKPRRERIIDVVMSVIEGAGIVPEDPPPPPSAEPPAPEQAAAAPPPAIERAPIPPAAVPPITPAVERPAHGGERQRAQRDDAAASKRLARSGGTREEKLKRLRNRLMNDPKLTALLK